MDLKQKFKDLLHISRDGEDEEAILNSSVEELGLTEAEMKLLSRDPENTIREIRTDPLADQEILETIEAAFVDEFCDGGRYQLNKLPIVLDLMLIRGERTNLVTQLSAVSRKLFSVILQKQVECAEELGRVLDLQDKLDTALGICNSGRLQLNRAKEHLTITSLGLLAHYRKRQHLLEIMKSLRAIQTLEQMGQRVQELLFEENYAAAIQLLVEGQRAADTYRHFNCVAQLSARLQDTLEMAEEQLDAGLFRICQNFSATLYHKLQLAFTLLGKQQVALDQLNLHLASGLHQNAYALVQKFVEESMSKTGGQKSNTISVDFSKIQFQELCKYVPSHQLITCLRDLCTCLWNVTLTYHRIHSWHNNQIQGEDSSGNFMEQKLQHGRSRLWQDVQNKIRSFLLASDLWHFSIDEFLLVLDMVDRLMEVGMEFCNSPSEILQETIRQQSSNYFRNFHRSRLEELRVFLEHEAWEACPVRSTFTVLQLAEFHFLPNNTTHPEILSESAAGERFYPFLFDVELPKSPFSNCPLTVRSEKNIMSKSRRSTTSGGRNSDSEDEDEPDGNNQGPLIANTTLSLLRLFGRYIHFMRLLKTIAFDVLICLNQLLDFYLYSVYIFFGTRPPDQCDAVLSPKLRDVLRRIGEMLIAKRQSITDGFLFAAEQSTFADDDRMLPPETSPLIHMDHGDNLYGFKMRLVAAESVVFVAHQIELLLPILKSLIPPTKESALNQFFAQTLAIAQDLRLPIYTSVACRSIDSELILGLMNRVQWDVKEVMSQHSNYIDVILQTLKDFDDMIHRASHQKQLPPEVYNILWDQTIRLAYRILLDGFSNVRKCTNEGRALMQLDLRQFQLKLEGLTRLRPLPDAYLIETYIKAFYLPETTLEEWVQQHTEYTPKQLMSLVQCVGQANKKTRLRLTALMEELDLSRR